MPKRISKPKDYAAELQTSFDLWDRLKIHGASDPCWADGCNMNLVRNHISNHKRYIEENYKQEDYPEIYYRETPPMVDNNYMARTDEILANAISSLKRYDTCPNLAHLTGIIGKLSEKQRKDTSIDNVIGYRTALEIAIKAMDYITMRRHEHTKNYLDSFASCADMIRTLDLTIIVESDYEQTTIFDYLEVTT